MFQSWPTTLLVVSHDRSFLNSVATDILHLHSQRIDTYRGDYETFVKTREDKAKNQQREYEAQQQYREHVQVKIVKIQSKSHSVRFSQMKSEKNVSHLSWQVFIDRFRYNAKRASIVQSKIKLLEKL